MVLEEGAWGKFPVTNPSQVGWGMVEPALVRLRRRRGGGELVV